MNPDPESNSEEPLLPEIAARLAEIQRIRAQLEALQARAEEQRRKLASAPPPPGAQEELAALMALPEEEQEKWLDGVLEVIQRHAGTIEQVPGLAEKVALVQAARARREEAHRLLAEVDEIGYQTLADASELTARQALRRAQVMKHWANLSEEAWSDLDSASRGMIMDLLDEWHAGEKERHLALLPLEVRRQYE